jgi:putative DNA primase/helicase
MGENATSMTFQDFAYEHGLIIDSLMTDRWTRVSTLDKPTKKNGAYVFDGHGGAVINFATMEKHAIYKSDKPQVVDFEKINRQNADRDRRQQEAKKKAAYILKQAIPSHHPYLEKKGFSEKGYVWKDLLVIPMRINSALVGLQMIRPDGNKRFLSGQITKGASLMIDNKGRDILVEGYATGLSVRRALKEMKIRYKIHVCFSASNMLEIAKNLENPFVIADNDPVGVSTAKKIASCYWLGEAGEDFNDFEVRLGAHQAGKSLLPLL